MDYCISASPLSFLLQKCIQPEEHFRQHVENGVRPDGREDLCALRPVSISAGTIGTADGSAVVKQGNLAFKFRRTFAPVFIFLPPECRWARH